MRKRSIDWYTLIPVLLLLCIGIIMVLSASSATTAAEVLRNQTGENEAQVNPFKYFNKQLVSVAIGLGAMYITSNIDYRKWKQFVKPALYTAIGLLLVVFAFPAKNGAHSWIVFGGKQFQPSEFVKLCLILILSHIISTKREKMNSFEKGLLPALVSIGIICGLVLMEPDLGSAMVIAITAFFMLFLGGANLKHLVALGGLGGILAGFAIIAEPYRFARLMAFIDPFKDPRGIGYQIIQSLYAIGSGGFFGVGLGRSMQKFGHIPEQHTDFIFSILAEELGFLGATLIIVLFLFFAARGLSIAKNTRDPFGSLLAGGITSLIVVEAIINIAVVTSSMPVTGITLPFISFGGSSLIFKLAAVGVLLNISKHTTLQTNLLFDKGMSNQS